MFVHSLSRLIIGIHIFQVKLSKLSSGLYSNSVAVQLNFLKKRPHLNLNIRSHARNITQIWRSHFANLNNLVYVITLCHEKALNKKAKKWWTSRLRCFLSFILFERYKIFWQFFRYMEHICAYLRDLYVSWNSFFFSHCNQK